MLQQHSFSGRYENIARTSVLKGRERIIDTYDHMHVGIIACMHDLDR